MKLPEIVGIAGASGAGKDTTGHLLAKFGYKFTSLSDTLRAELDVQIGAYPRKYARPQLTSGTVNLALGISRSAQLRYTEKKKTHLATRALR